MIKIKLPPKKNINHIKKFFKKKGLDILLNSANNESNVFRPNLQDLYRLYNFVILNKRTTVLEFGSGWSSLILSAALNELIIKMLLI
jgi:hypothetical protein